ncbi:MAG: hypothetical protein AB4911_01055 [Oscillochloridaceae bacterium umkhey_bin13]
MAAASVLSSRLIDPQRFVTLYGTTPPRLSTVPEQVIVTAHKLAERVAGLDLDGLVVYDVQDEQERTDQPRPFPFLPTIDPRRYAALLHAMTGLEAITYKCVVNLSEPAWLGWLDETVSTYGLHCLSLVGAATPHPAPYALPIDRAITLAAAQVGGPTLGAVTIAERHLPGFDESRRLIHKASQGCRYFISQVVYDVGPTIGLLSDYVRACAESGVAPQRVVLTFSPCGRAKTLDFIRWLGVAIAPATAQVILSDPAPFRRSIAICCANLRAILDCGFAARLPLGLNIESVSIHRDEIEASIELVHALREVAAEYGLQG